MSSIVVIGLGNDMRGDDMAGTRVARDLQVLHPDDVDVFCACDASRLPCLWDGYDAAIVVDACRSGSAAGTLHRIDAGATDLSAFPHDRSSHTFSVAAAISVSRSLGMLPRTVVILGVEGASFDTGSAMSGPVRAALPRLLRNLIVEVSRARMSV